MGIVLACGVGNTEPGVFIHIITCRHKCVLWCDVVM